MSFVGTAIDHSKLEDISYTGHQSEDDDEVYISDGEQENANEELVRDCFPNEIVIANKQCKIYPKSRHYAVIRFGDGYADKAIALPKVMCHEDDVIDGERMMTDISWGHDGWINARRDSVSSVKWKVTLLWTGMRKPAGLNNNAHHDDAQWKQLLQEYEDLGDVDVSMKQVSVPTLKSLANDLSASDKLTFEMKENVVSCKEIAGFSSREFSNMLEDIDEHHSEASFESDTLRGHSVVAENLQKVAVVQKVERNKLIFMPIQYNGSKFSGHYSLSVPKQRVYIRGEWAGKLELKAVVCPGESFNINCDLLFDDENKEMIGDVKKAWNGKAPDNDLTTDLNETKIKAGNTNILPDNKSLEPIDTTDPSDNLDYQFVKNIGGKVKLVTQSFVCVEPVKKEFQDKEPYPVMSKNFYFANGRTGEAYEDLTKSVLKLDDYVKMNVAKVDGKLIVISAWEGGAKPPKGDEARAIDIVKRIRKKNQKPVPVITHGKLEEPTPQSQMSARPHSPSHFRLTSELRRPKSLTECKPLRVPEKLPPSLTASHSSDSSDDISTKRVTKGIMSKTSNLSKPKSVSYQEPLSPLPVPLCSAFSNKDAKTANRREFNNEWDNKTVSFSERSNPEAVLNIIEQSFQKSIEKTKSSLSLEGANAYSSQFMATAKQTFIESLNKELQVSAVCAEQTWSSFENFINLFYSMTNDDMKGDSSRTHCKSTSKCNNNVASAQAADANTQTMTTGRVFFEECFLE